MEQLINPCEGCEDKFCERYDIDCIDYDLYLTRLDERPNVWKYIGEEFYEPVINLYIADDNTKRIVRELWQSLKKGAGLGE